MRTFLGMNILVWALYSCLDSQFDVNDLIAESDLVYLDASQSKDNYPNDEYRLVSVTPDGNRWSVVVEYAGGCEEHQFFTHWDGEDGNIYNLHEKVSFSLLHNNRGDQCERLVRDTLELDLSNVFNNKYTDEDTIFMEVVNGFTGNKIEVDPYLARLTQGSECVHDVSLLGTACNNGFWQNQWLLFRDTVAGYEKVWIQPVRGSDPKIPASGDYKIGIKLLFGFQYSEKVCEDRPSGKIVPATVTCLESI